MRLDSYLAEKYPEYSRSVWQKFIKKGYVKVNNEVVTVTKYDVTEPDMITYELPDLLTISKLITDLPILYEDENVIVINKPAGILTHSKGALNEEYTVADFIRSRSPSNHLTNQQSNRFGIVHRLDRNTSGVLIGAKNEETLKFLQKQFSNRTVKKTYHAMVNKIPRNSEFIIDLPIARNPKKPSTFRVDPKGKPAITKVRIGSIRVGTSRTVLILKPLTGRTHQLRVHLAYMGMPIIGDNIYNRDERRETRDEKVCICDYWGWGVE